MNHNYKTRYERIMGKFDVSLLEARDRYGDGLGWYRTPQEYLRSVQYHIDRNERLGIDHNSRAMSDAYWLVNDLRTSERGSALTPVIAILTAFSAALVLLGQSGLLHAVMARLAEVR
jgi:hypothetical protein